MGRTIRRGSKYGLEFSVQRTDSLGVGGRKSPARLLIGASHMASRARGPAARTADAPAWLFRGRECSLVDS